MSRALLFLLGLFALLLAIIMILGLVNVTNIVFGNRTYDNLSSSQRTLAKTFVVLTWIQIILSVIIGLYEIVG